MRPTDVDEGCRVQVRVRVGRLNAKDEVLPLRVVAEESAAAGRNSASSTEDLKIRGMRLVSTVVCCKLNWTSGRVALEKSDVALPRLTSPPK